MPDCSNLCTRSNNLVYYFITIRCFNHLGLLLKAGRDRVGLPDGGEVTAAYGWWCWTVDPSPRHYNRDFTSLYDVTSCRQTASSGQFTSLPPLVTAWTYSVCPTELSSKARRLYAPLVHCDNIFLPNFSHFPSSTTFSFR